MNAETLRTICLALPATTESIKWENNVVFSIADKMFCITSFEEPFAFSFKVADEVFDDIAMQQGFTPAPYLARAKWVLASADAKVSRKQCEAFMRDSYNLVVAKLSKKQRSLLHI